MNIYKQSCSLPSTSKNKAVHFPWKSTNKLLRSRLGGGVAKKSLHLLGQAADISMPGRTVNQVARAAAKCAGGGVGKYSGSQFVHIDCGEIRVWGE